MQKKANRSIVIYTRLNFLDLQPKVLLMSIPLKISGFADYSEKENRLFSHWKQKLEETYRLFGFMGFNPRPVESIAAMQSKGGIAHQIYTLGRLQDGSMTDLALPFDRTIPLAIYVAGHKNELTYPFKRFDISHSFRGERPQAGRLRGFIQADIDVIDEKLNRLSEVECLLVVIKALKGLEIPDFTIHLNHISIPKAIIKQMGIPLEQTAEALRIVDKMDKIGFEKVKEELLLIHPFLDLELLELLSFKGDFREFSKKSPLKLKEEADFAAMEDLLSLLENQVNAPSLFSFNPGMVRGLDYYTGLVFETFLKEYPHFGSIASGGKYDNLVDSILNEKTHLEGFGISIGLSRLFDVLRKEKLLPVTPTPPAKVLVAYRETTLQNEAFVVACRLRDQGISVDLYLGKSNIGKQLSYANKKEIPYAFMLMGETFVIKDLNSGSQTEDISSLEDAIKKMEEFSKNN